MKKFHPHKDKIAVVVKNFTLKKKSDIFFQKYSEPYIISLAIDQRGASNPKIDFNILPFPHVQTGDTVSFDGQGHLIYGPKNPGEFIVYSVLFMESDQDLRNLGKQIEDILKSEAINIGVKALLIANPTYSTAITVLQKLSELISVKLKENKDDELFRRNGTLLRESVPPYDILRTYESENAYIKTNIAIIQLSTSNKLGSQMTKLLL